MNLVKNKLTIRNATTADTPILHRWWNDGSVMAHAGFPNGLGITEEKIAADIATNSDATARLHIVEYAGQPIGEMSYHTEKNTGNRTATIGIKICNPTHQEKGIGTTALSIFIDALFTYYGYEKVALDVNVKNKRAKHVYENKIGFKMLQLQENAWQDQLGVWQSCIDYELTQTDWATKPKIEYIHLRLERPEEHDATEAISREAHWGNGWSMTPEITDVPLLVHRLRHCPAYVPALHYVAEIDRQLVGHIVYSTAHITEEVAEEVAEENGATHPMLTFGPLSVLPAYQGRGVGKALLYFTFGEAARLGHKGIFIFGHPDYYPRVGFAPASDFGITDHQGKSYDPFMTLPLYENALAGVQGRFHLSPVYEELAYEDVVAFDKKFPPKALPTPVPATVLLEKLSPAAQAALADVQGKSLAYMQTKSENALRQLAGIDAVALATIKATMAEYGRPWGREN